MMFRRNEVTRGKGRLREVGFTLVELMMTLLILGLIMSVVYRIFSSQEHMFRTQEQVASMQENLRTTMEYLNQEMSWIGYQVQGTAVLKATPTDIVFRANIPNTSDPIQFVRYKYDSDSDSILRWAGPNSADVAGTFVVMATDIQAMSFSFFNVGNAQIVADSGGTPVPPSLCSNVLSTAACSPSEPDLADVKSLLMIQRIKSRVTARTSREDYAYTDPDEGDHYRKRSAILDVRARNIEDATWVAGQIGTGFCGNLVPTITVPAGGYNACRDQRSMINYGVPDDTNGWNDNPKIVIEATDENGNANMYTDMSVTINARGTDGLRTLFRSYDPVDDGQDSGIDNSGERYLVADALSDVSTGNQIEVSFNYLDGVCTMVVVTSDTLIDIVAGDPAYFDTSASYGTDGLDVRYVEVSSGSTLSPVPDEVALCSSAADEGVRLTSRIVDECGNPIPGENLLWSDGGAGGSFINTTPAGNGTYSATYVPPDSMGSPAPAYTVNLSAQWGSFVLTTTQILVPADPYDIVIDDIVEQSGSGLYDFSSSILPDNGSTFEIERVDGQLVRIDFHLEDECGNRVYVDETGFEIDVTTGEDGEVQEADGLYSFTWKSTAGCGAAMPDETITINYGSLSETVGFDLFETESGPRLRLDLGGTGTLVAGDTSDSITIAATVEEYNETLQLCVNVPGPNEVSFVVEGSEPTRSGSFSGTEFDVTTKSATTDTLTGVVEVDLYPGTAQCPASAICDALTLTATADVDGALYVETLGIGLDPSDPDETYSGFMHSSYNEVDKVGEDQGDRSYDPGETIYFQIKDYDENESPYSVDSTSPLYARVTLTVERTGDSETVNLTENLANDALFRGQIDAVLATGAVPGDNLLQVMYGDYIHMHYEDKDDPAEFDDWFVFTSGVRTMNLYLVEGAAETDIFSAGIQSEDIQYEDDIRVKLFFPEHEGDGSSIAATDSIFLFSGADGDLSGDVLKLREEGDTGIFIPDWTLYGASTFRVSENDPSDQVYRLYIPSTPRTVTVSYPDALTPTIEKSFVLYDQDGPQVEITAPSDSDTVNSTVLVTVNASDVGNTSPLGGISRVELYINGNLYNAYVGTPDLTGDSEFTWTTTLGSMATWLDGTHVLTAKAYDMMGNPTTSLPVTVILNNNIIPIEFVSPTFDSVWGSITIPVEVQVSELDSTGGPYDVYLSVSPDPAVLMADAGSGTYTADVDGGALTDGTYTLIAQVQDSFGNYRSVSLDLDVDKTPPDINNWWWPDDWVNMWWGDPVWFDFEVRDLHGFADSTNPVLVSLTGPNGFSNKSPQWWGSWIDGSENVSSYSFTWSLPVAGYEGSISWTVNAWDSSNPANMGTLTQVVNVDTIPPTMDAPTVSPALGSFISGTVDISTTLHDTYPWFVQVDIYDTMWNWVDSNWADSAPNVDGSGNFTWQWDTTAVSDGPYILQVGGHDRAWNEVEDWWMNEYTYYVDNTPPNCSRPYQYRQYVADNKVNIDYRVTDATSGVQEVEFAFTRDPNTILSGPVVLSDTVSFPFSSDLNTVMETATLDVSGLSSDRYNVYIRARDWMGNLSSWSPALLAELDRFNIQSLNVSYLNMGMNYEFTNTGTLYEGTNPASGSTLLLTYRVLPAASTTYQWTYNIVVNTDGVGFYSDTYPSFLDSGDQVRVYLNSVIGNQIGYFDATVPGAPSYVSLRQPLLIADPDLTYTYNSLLDEYTYEVGGVALDINGPIPAAAIMVQYSHYDPTGVYLDGGTVNTTALGDGSYQAAIPGSYPTGDRLSVYIYVNGSFAGAHYYRDPLDSSYYYVPYTYPWF